jgi:hypothetical protein
MARSGHHERPRGDGCGVRVHTIPESFATSIAATPLMDPLVLLIIDYLRSAHRGHLLGLWDNGEPPGGHGRRAPGPEY